MEGRLGKRTRPESSIGQVILDHLGAGRIHSTG
jgi:hypothetical protein